MFIIRRDPNNPILTPNRSHPWEARATFNPSVVRSKEGWNLFYRALGNPDVLQTPDAGLSTIGMAFSEDGTHFHSQTQIVIPQESWDAFGCEDPRVTFFEGRWYCFYTALGGYPFGPDNIKVAVALGDAPNALTERHLITPFNAKAATLFPERINGEVVLLLTAHTDWTQDYPHPTIAVARAKNISDFFSPTYWEKWHKNLADHALPDLRRADHDHMEVGATPILTDQGWLLIYSYIKEYYNEDKRVFTIEAALLDRNDSQKILSRTYPFMAPQEIYEEYGLVPHIVFPTSATIEGDMLDIWYGGADTVCAKARVRLSDLMRALNPKMPARTFKRVSHSPVLSPRGSGFESRAVFNPAAIDVDGTIYILYRAMDAANTSRIGLALSKDGIHIDERLSEAIYSPRAEFEQKLGKPDGNSGCEDPRIVCIDKTLYMTYTAYDGVHAPKGAFSSIGVADFKARRFDAWSKPVLITPNGIDDKDLGFLPKHINNSFLLYHRISNQICTDILPDLFSGKCVSRCIEIIGPRRGMWDGAKVGIAAPPIPLGDKWLLIYHGVSEGGATYRLGAILLDTNGITVLARTADQLFEPVEPWEKNGEISNVVFACGAVVRDDTLFLYYGGGDKVVGIATASLSHIKKALS